MNTPVKTHIEIEGVILTSAAIHYLVDLQNHGNDNLNYSINILAEAVCFIGSNIYMFNDHQEAERKKAIEIISDLCFIRDNIKQLAKP